MIVENYQRIRERVDAACLRAGRRPEEVTLIAVSKTKPAEQIRELLAAGVADFGENYPQELAEKYQDIDGGIRWHFIGHLQTNKVKLVVGRACMIHSISSEHLAKAVSDASVKQGIRTPVLIEVNIGEEETKLGLPAAAVPELIRRIAGYPGLDIRGLMAIAPPVEQPEENRVCFRALRELRDRINAAGILQAPMTELSMGMTGDFEVAVEEGATFVRVGTAIFGARDYSRRDAKT